MRVIVADDGLIGDLLARSFPDYGLEVIGQARSTQKLLRLVDAEPPDIIILDIEMPRRDTDTKPELDAGLYAARQIRARHPSIAILALSQHAEVAWAEEVISLGTAVGYQLKDRVQRMDTLVDVMRAVAGGDIRIDTSLISALVARKRLNDPVERLRPREREVLQLIAEGLSNAAIARRLFIEESTVEGYETSIYRTLGLSNCPAGAHGKPTINVRVMAVLAFLKSGERASRVTNQPSIIP